jgi:hypothetical protein
MALPCDMCGTDSTSKAPRLPSFCDLLQAHVGDFNLSGMSQISRPRTSNIDSRSKISQVSHERIAC